MSRLARAELIALAAFAPLASGQTPEPAARYTASVTGSYYAMRDEPDFGVGVASVNRGPLRFEMRYNYEAKHATSAFVGWKLAGADAVTYEVTPIIGGLFGGAHGVIPGVEASFAYRQIDAYIEAEYVIDSHDRTDNYFYAWSELGFRPVEWLRFGLVGQRTRIVHDERDLQRGVFGQLTLGSLTLGLYAFNPDSRSRYAIVSVGMTF